jgi:hypothetical protein
VPHQRFDCHLIACSVLQSTDFPYAICTVCVRRIIHSDPLRRYEAGQGTIVGIAGIGGLGQMGIKLAKAMGCTCGFFSLPFRLATVRVSECRFASCLPAAHFRHQVSPALVSLTFPTVQSLHSTLTRRCVFMCPVCFAASLLFRCHRPSHRHHSLRRKGRVRAQMRRRPRAARYVAWCHGWQSIIRTHNLRRPANISIYYSFSTRAEKQS